MKIESLKEYAQMRMEKLQQAFPKVTKISIVIDVDVKKHMYMAEVVANRLGETAVGAKEFSESGKSVIDAAAARADTNCEGGSGIFSDLCGEAYTDMFNGLRPAERDHTAGTGYAGFPFDLPASPRLGVLYRF